MAQKLWKIYYGDGTTFSDQDGTWEDAPLDNVQAVAVYNETWGRRVFYGTEFYLPGDKVSINTIFGVDYLQEHMRAHNRYIKYGRTIERKIADGLFDTAMHDPDFPMKSPRRRSTDWE